MNAQYDTINKILPLIDTMEEGLAYSKIKLMEFKDDVVINIMLDIMDAFTSIEKVIIHLQDKLLENNISKKTESMKKAFSIFISLFEDGRSNKALEVMQFTLEPAFVNWKKEVNKTFKPYLC